MLQKRNFLYRALLPSFLLRLDKSWANSMSKLLSESVSRLLKSLLFWYCSLWVGDKFHGKTGTTWWVFFGPQSLIRASIENGLGTGLAGRAACDWAISVWGWSSRENSIFVRFSHFTVTKTLHVRHCLYCKHYCVTTLLMQIQNYITTLSWLEGPSERLWPWLNGKFRQKGVFSCLGPPSMFLLVRRAPIGVNVIIVAASGINNI